MEENIINLADKISNFFEVEGADIRSFSPLTLAFIGDAFYEIIIRTIIIKKGNAPCNKLHKKTSSLVKASAQKDLLNKIIPLLTEEELKVYKRGRNAKAHTYPKNADILDYRIATGFESLVGFLYLKGKTDRIMELVKIGMDNDKNSDI